MFFKPPIRAATAIQPRENRLIRRCYTYTNHGAGLLLGSQVVHREEEGRQGAYIPTMALCIRSGMFAYM